MINDTAKTNLDWALKMDKTKAFDLTISSNERKKNSG